jgi:hypothetical protein
MKKFNIFSAPLLYLLFFVAIFQINACTKDFKLINTDKNTIATIGPAELQLIQP